MSMSLLEHSNHLIDDNRRRIERYRAEMGSAAIDSALRERVLQQMELSLACIVRHRDALASRLKGGSLNSQGV
jgi:hypothetical protein